jgi:GAF domain-containing protein
MNILNYLSPQIPPAHIEKQGELTVLRERILQSIMLVVSGFALVAFVLLSVQTIFSGSWGFFLLYFVLTVVTCAGALYRGIPYRFRAASIPLLIYGSGIYAFISDGLFGDGKLYMLGFIVLTGILLGLVPGISALIIGVITISIFGFGMVGGWIPAPSPVIMSTPTGDPTEWLIASVFTAVLGTLTAVSLAFLINNLQLSLVKQTNLSAELNVERGSLQTKIEQRTADIQRRLAQIRTAAEVSRQISILQEPQKLLQLVVNLVRDNFELYYVGVFIIDDHNYAVLKAGTGEAGQKMLALGHRLQVGGSSMIGWCVSNQTPRIALDVGFERVRFSNPNLPETRSELALPIVSRGKSLGAMTIQSRRPEAFDEDDIRILQGIADSLAIALENSRLFLEAQDVLDEIQALNKAYLDKGWSEAQAIYGDLRYTYDNKDAAGNNSGHIIQIPLTLREQIIGQITLETNSPTLSKEEIDFVEAITTQTALALENARLLNDSQRKASQEETLNRLSLQFSRGSNIEDILSMAVKELSELPAVSEVSVHMLSPELLEAGAGNNHNGHKAETS